jgi:histidyl-tRNA synthetase
VSARARIERPRGTHDVTPAEQPLWRHVVDEAERLCRLYGYRPILTPVFEDTALFERTSGAGSDVVQKEMYTFDDRGGRSLTLRPEGTAPICRAYVEHGMHRDPQPAKLYTLDTMYRYSAPQRGRYREHWQLSVEAVGSHEPSVDAEVIQLYHALLGRLGIRDFELELNSIGCRECRPAYLERLRSWLDANLERLDATTREKAATSPLRVFDNLDAKPDHTRRALAEAPAIGDELCDACREHFAAVRSFLDAYGVRYELVPTLVRGLDYYTRTTWEFVGPALGAQSTISGGGRYDGLVEEIGGRPTPGVGFGAGIERLALAVEEAAAAEAAPPRIDVFFMFADGGARAGALAEMAKLRAAGVACDAEYAGRSLKGQRTQLARLGASGYVLVAGDTATVRRGRDDEEHEVPVGAIAEAFLG